MMKTTHICLEATLQAQLQDIQVLIVPGWKNSGPAHWQSHWEDKFPEWQRVQQGNWLQPQRGDWVSALDTAIRASTQPVLLIAHSLGCITLAHWAAENPGTTKIAGALLVAPADVERSSVAEPLRDFAPIPREPLSFPALMVASDNDPACQLERAEELARDWQCDLQTLSGVGHINASSRLPSGQPLADWENGLQRLSAWLPSAERLAEPSWPVGPLSSKYFRWAA